MHGTSSWGIGQSKGCSCRLGPGALTLAPSSRGPLGNCFLSAPKSLRSFDCIGDTFFSGIVLFSLEIPSPIE